MAVLPPAAIDVAVLIVSLGVARLPVVLRSKGVTVIVKLSKEPALAIVRWTGPPPRWIWVDLVRGESAERP